MMKRYGFLFAVLVSAFCILHSALECSAQTVRTENFTVTGPDAKQIAEACELQRQRIAETLLGEQMPPWNAPAQIEAPGQRTGDSGGAVTQFQFSEGEAFDFSGRWRGDREQMLANVVPHEVCHLVLASHFRRPLPRWYDEGLSTWFEAHRAKTAHYDLARGALKARRTAELRWLFAQADYPPDVLAFYAQSASVAHWLIDAEGPRTFLAFGERGLADGWDKALEATYGITLPQAQRHWVAQLDYQNPCVGDWCEQPQPWRPAGPQIFVRPRQPQPRQNATAGPGVRGLPPAADCKCDPAELAALKRELATIQKQNDDAKGWLTHAYDKINGRITTLETADGADLGPLEDRVAVLEEKLEPVDWKPLADRVAEIEKRPQELDVIFQGAPGQEDEALRIRLGRDALVIPPVELQFSTVTASMDELDSRGSGPTAARLGTPVPLVNYRAK